MDKIAPAAVGLLAGIILGLVLGLFAKDYISMKVQKAAMEGAAAEISKIQITNTTIQGKVIERWRTEKVYQECLHSDAAWADLMGAYK